MNSRPFPAESTAHDVTASKTALSGDERADQPILSVLNQKQRTSALLLGAALLGLLVVAGLLKPNPAGMGTHRQLGLPPCTTVAILGIPCPTCGMTTSWSHFMRGEWRASWAANPGGFCLAIMSLVAAAWSWSIAARGRYWALLHRKVGFAIVIAVVAITLIDWATKLF